MPRVDQTFSGADLIRIWTENLTDEEREDVRCFFFLVEIARRDKFRAISLVLRLLLKFVLKFPVIERIILRLIDIVDELESRDQCMKRIGRL